MKYLKNMVYGMKHRKIINKISIIFFIFIFFLTGCYKKDNITTIKFSTWGSETEISILKPIIKEFEENNPDIKVEIMHIPQNYFQKLHMLVAANLTPDVIFLNNLNMPVYASGDILMDLNKNLTKSKEINNEDFFKESLKTMSYNNQLMAVPRDISNIVVYYNKDIFDKYKVSYPDEDWTIEDFLKTAKQLTRDTNNDGRTDLFGISFRTLPIFYLPFVWSNGGKLFENKNKKFAMSEKDSCEGIQYYSNLRNLYHVAPKAVESGNNTMAQLFMQERIAMFVSGRWNVPRFREDIKFKWDITCFPSGKSGSIVGIDGSGWAISKNSKNPKAAWKLVEFLASKDSIEKFSKTGLIVPARKDIAYSNIFIEKGSSPKHSEIFLTIIKNGQPTPQIERWNEVTDIVDVALEPVWNGKADACKVLNNIKSDINELLE